MDAIKFHLEQIQDHLQVLIPVLQHGICNPPTPTSSITGYDCVSGNCVTASVGTGSYATLESCSIYCTQSYGWNCDPITTYCIPGTINNTGSYTTYESCSVVCNDPPPTSSYCPCNPLYSTYIFSSFISGWIYNDPIINEYGITNWGFGNNSANIIILPSASSGVYLTRPNIFQISCSYNVCFDSYFIFTNRKYNSSNKFSFK
jgi:hypothetical protein